MIDAAEKMDVPFVNTFMGGDEARNQDENWDGGPPRLARHRPYAQDHGRKITLENCPMLFSLRRVAGRQQHRHDPAMWRRILEQWGGTIGLNFDPSHLVRQMIDIQRFLREFGKHVLHYQAKDLMIDRDGLYERGGSHRHGLADPTDPGPGRRGLGVVHGELYLEGYDGDCIIEHEDRRFEGTDEIVKHGFLHRT